VEALADQVLGVRLEQEWTLHGQKPLTFYCRFDS
jgi:hypothetical protein